MPTTAILSSYKIFQSLKGAWNFSRIIENHLAPGLSGTVTGSASFISSEDDDNQLFYRETGVFVTNKGDKIPATKEYFYVYDSTTDKIKVHFAEKGIKTGLFHIINNECADDHLCIRDLYKTAYDFFEQNKFSITYTVSGPAKSYVSTTTFTRRPQ